MSDYYEKLILAVERADLHRPVLVVDELRLQQNLKTIQNALPSSIALRLADKSIPVPALLASGFDAFETSRIMSFHLPLTAQVLNRFPQSEILMGKPMPIAAAAQFISSHQGAERITWLIDSADHMAAYRSLAIQTGKELRIAFEVNIGLGRGGFENPGELDGIIANSSPLKICGLMGYEAHIHALPKILGGGSRAQDKAMEALAAFASRLAPDQREIINTGGSSTILGLPHESAANDFTLGSLMIKPSDFEQPFNGEILPAAFIVTPVLKTCSHQLPGNPALTRFLKKTRIIRDQIAFAYGGKWMADPVYPNGLSASPFFTPSSNQHGFCLPNGSSAPSHIVFRPTQSEAVLQQFPKLHVFDGEGIKETWEPFDI